MSDNIKELILVGTGTMAREYAKVLDGLGIPYKVVGNTSASVKKFRDDTQKNAIEGGIEKYILSQKTIPHYAIVATNIEKLYKITKILITSGVKEILVEKPGIVTMEQINDLIQEAKKYGTKVFIAYNRRFYSSVKILKQIVQDDGGIQSVNFEFTEWPHVVEKTLHSDEIKQKWFLMNSSHVVDLVFYLIGKPREMNSYRKGELKWHKAGCIYAGCGVTEKDIVFSYQANWKAPGRWGVEVLTDKHRLYLRPIEKLQIQNIGSIMIEEKELNDNIDQIYKPGLFEEVYAMIKGGDFAKELCTLEEQKGNMKLYKKISGEVY